MLINKKVSIIEINQNFSKVAKIASEEGSVVATQNNKLEYILLKINNNQNYETADNVELDAISKKWCIKIWKHVKIPLARVAILLFFWFIKCKRISLPLVHYRNNQVDLDNYLSKVYYDHNSE